MPPPLRAARRSAVPRLIAILPHRVGGQGVVLHCNTGILAKKAYDFLTAKGYTRARYLNAVIVVGPQGTYEVTEK